MRNTSNAKGVLFTAEESSLMRAPSEQGHFASSYLQAVAHNL